MGNIYSGVIQTIKDEYERVRQLNKEEDRDYLVLDQILNIQLPQSETHPVDFTHVGTLFVLDKEKDGRFTLEGLIEFAERCKNISEMQNIRHDFKTHIQAHFTLCMWSIVAKENGDELFADWICTLFSRNSLKGQPIKEFSQLPGQIFYLKDTIKTLYNILAIKKSYGISWKTFVSLMQRVAEEQNLPTDDKVLILKEYVHKEVLKQFARSFIKGFVNLMLELGFDPNSKVIT